MKYRHHLYAYEKHLNEFKRNPQSLSAYRAGLCAQQHAIELRRQEKKRRNGRIRSPLQIWKRRMQRRKDLEEEHRTGQHAHLFSRYRVGMPCVIRTRQDFAEYKIIQADIPGELVIQRVNSENGLVDPYAQPRTMTYRLLRKRKHAKQGERRWFGLWVEKNLSCQEWHDKDRSFHIATSIDTKVGRTEVFESEWVWNPASQSVWLPHWAIYKIRTWIPPPIGVAYQN